MAQYLPPADGAQILPFLPRPQRQDNATITPTMPMTTTIAEPRPAETGNDESTGASSSPATAVVEGSVYVVQKTRPALPRRFLAACVAVANQASALVIRYRVELAPAMTVGAVTGLGWWQYLAGVGGWGTAAYAGLAVLGAAVTAAGVEKKDEMLTRAGAGLTLTFADVATAVGTGPGGVSLTAAAVTTGAAYAVYVPWLIQHRKDHKALPGKASATAKANASVDVQLHQGGQAALKASASSSTEEQSTPRGPGGPFHDRVIPYADDDSDDITKPIRLGWTEYGQPVLLTVMYRHTLVAGASDWGKSGIINLIIKKLLKKKHVELFGIDMKPGAVELGPWEPKMRRLARTAEEARELLQYIRAECDRRGAYLEELSKREMAAGREPVRKWIPGVHGPAWIVVTDELAELIRQDEELRKQEAELRKLDPEMGPPEQDIATTYESALAIARSMGIMFLSATQQPSAKVFGGSSDARGNYANRISTRVGEAGHSVFIFGQGCKSNGFTPEKLTRPGEFYIGCPEMPLTDPPKCRAEYVTDLDIAADVAHLHAAAPAQTRPVGGGVQASLFKPAPARPVGPPPPVYPDGTMVGRDEWIDLYRVFLQLCEEEGYATKERLVEEGPFGSRDTVRRALDLWKTHGVQSRKAGKAEQFYLPGAEE
ncbi:FtsK/SpoIIIE domain-containing protein [Kitasatospora sp. NPDC048239]|uniref:FtsK/SpoIIIE domain-containing protein n=1 Tax=Kitasatospora sp. NPDC048239 TaxID=3364046 RepID=UPI0037111675